MLILLTSLVLTACTNSSQTESFVNEQEQVIEAVSHSESEESENAEAEQYYIEATEEDFSLLDEQIPALIAVGYYEDFDSATFDQDDMYMWIANMFHFYLGNVSGLPIEIHEPELVFGNDPRGYYNELYYLRANADEIDWIAENVFNITLDISQFSLEEMEDTFKSLDELDGFFYKDDGYYYLCVDGFGIQDAEEISILDSSHQNGIYDINILVENPSVDERFELQLSAYLKEENGIKYWSFLKVTTQIQGSEKTMYDEETILRACENYTGAPIIEIEDDANV